MLNQQAKVACVHRFVEFGHLAHDLTRGRRSTMFSEVFQSPWGTENSSRNREDVLEHLWSAMDNVRVQVIIWTNWRGL